MFNASRSLPSCIQTVKKNCNRQRTFCSQAPETRAVSTTVSIDQGLPRFLLPQNGCRKVGHLEIMETNVIEEKNSIHMFRHLFGGYCMVIHCFCSHGKNVLVECSKIGSGCDLQIILTHSNRVDHGKKIEKNHWPVSTLRIQGLLCWTAFTARCRGCIYSINHNTSWRGSRHSLQRL